MNRHKLSLIIAALAAAVIVAGGWFLGVQPQLAAASAATDQTASIATTNDANRLELTRLEKQFASIDKSKAELADLGKSVPSTSSTNAFVRELNSVAVSSGVTITSITIADAQQYTPPQTAAETPTDSSSSSATASPSASASASASAGPVLPAAPKAHTDGSITSSNFDVIPVSVAVTGDDAKALQFARGVQTGDRLFLANSFAGTTNADGSKSWSLTGYIYVLNATSAASATPAAG